jgi:hypothetical protein
MYIYHSYWKKYLMELTELIKIALIGLGGILLLVIFIPIVYGMVSKKKSAPPKQTGDAKVRDLKTVVHKPQVEAPQNRQAAGEIIMPPPPKEMSINRPEPVQKPPAHSSNGHKPAAAPQKKAVDWRSQWQ